MGIWTGADGNAIGSLVELFIISTDWRVESIRVELKKDIADRIGESHAPSPRHDRAAGQLIQSVGDAVVLSIEVDKLREARRSPERDEAPHPGP